MIGWRIACALALAALAALAPVTWAQSLPPSIRACAAESDAALRHACYDREVTRILEAEKGTSIRQSGAVASSPAASPSAASSSPAAASSAAPASNLAAVGAASAAQPTSHSRRAQSSDRFSARIVRVDSSPDELVLHLDNGDIWEQADRTPGGLGLHAGDSVTIERSLGSFWLSARHVSGMRVRKKPD